MTEMSILALFRWEGEADALVAAYDREMHNAPAVTLEQPRRALHVFARSETGAVVADLWDTDGDFRRMMGDPAFRRNVAAAGWPSEPDLRVYAVHATMPCPRRNA
jgi:hypothetical protein